MADLFVATVMWCREGGLARALAAVIMAAARSAHTRRAKRRTCASGEEKAAASLKHGHHFCRLHPVCRLEARDHHGVFFVFGGWNRKRAFCEESARTAAVESLMIGLTH